VKKFPYKGSKRPFLKSDWAAFFMGANMGANVVKKMGANVGATQRILPPFFTFFRKIGGLAANTLLGQKSTQKPHF